VAEAPPEGIWGDEEGYVSYEVSRYGDQVHFVLSKIDGSSYVLEFSPEDAQQIGIALAQAGQEPEESE
jgi:hypothetical protein